MKKSVIMLALAVGLAQAAGDHGRPPNRPPRAKAKAVDLDLTLDFADEAAESAPPPRTAAAAHKQGSHAWIYWAMGATVAAGGLGWYLHDQQDVQPGVKRSEQVFTDER